MNEFAGSEADIDSFIPLQFRSGVFAREFLLAHKNKDIVVWGAGFLGRCLMRLLKAFAEPYQNFYFSDSNPKFHAKEVDGSLVLDFNQALARMRNGNSFMVLAVAGYLKEAINQLTQSGFKQSEDFDTYLKISRPEAVIQISRNNGGVEENMSLETFKATLEKLKFDVPDLFHIDLSGWGEPLNNPHLPEIIRTAQLAAPCTVTTGLIADFEIIENVLLSAPAQFTVSVDGFNSSYIENTINGNFEWFLSRLKKLSSIQETYNKKTEIRVKYNIFKNNASSDFNAMQLLCEQLDIKLVRSIGYINPYDKLLDASNRNFIDSVGENLAWPLRLALDLARTDQANSCLCQRIFPVIHTDGSVGICHLYEKPRVHEQYLSIDWIALQHLRIEAPHCRACQQQAFHRLDVEVLELRHNKKLLLSKENTHA